MFSFLNFHYEPYGIVILTLLLGLIMHKRLIRRETLDWHSRVEKQQTLAKIASLELEMLKAREGQILGKELEIVKLYEITKKMSESLRLDDIFGIFSTFLKENFTFRKSELLILKKREADLRIERSYKVWKSKQVEDEDQINYQRLITLHLESKKELYFTRDSDGHNFIDLKINKDVQTFISIPLLSEKKMVGVLTIENLELERERLAILSIQFALELKKVLLYETVEELAITDSLTGLYVRRYFLERLNEELSRSKRYKFKFAYLMADIDNFKEINDTHGHLVGDVILKGVSRIIKESTREIDLVARYGGEEFSILLPETTRDGAALVAERLRKKVEENTFRAYDEKLKTTISIGIAIYPEDAKDPSDLIEKADVALYAAKGAGKNLVCEYKKEYNNKFKSEAI